MIADLVLYGPAYTVDAARSWTDALAVRGDRIIALGSEDVAAVTGPGTRRIDAPAGMILPGFQDAHVHPPFAGRNRLNVWLTDAHGRPEYLELIAGYVAAHPGDGWVIGGGWAMEHFPGGTPRAADLDPVTGNRPAFLYNRDVHGAWVNSRTLELAGITRDTPDPADGRIERDPVTGEPTGMLHEGAAYSVEARLLPTPAGADWQVAIGNAQQHLHSLGITGWQDAWVTPGTYEAYQSMAESGTLTARVVGALWWDRHRGLEQIPEFLAQREAGGHERFRPTSVKIMTDGVLENFTGALLEPYCDGCGGHSDSSGLDFIEPELLTAAVTELDRLGFDIHLHTIGDRAVRNALNAIEAAQAAHGRRGNRHQLAHVQLVHPEDVPRFRRLGVTANCQTFWAQSEPQMDELTIPFLGRDRALRQYPFGDLMRAGATLAMGSDWAVTTADPLQQLEVAVRRIDPGNRANAPFLPEQRLPLPVAVAAFTAGSAWVNTDVEAGTLSVGNRADLTVLSANIFDQRAGAIGDARVLATVAAGRVVHDAGV